jgi:phosphomannomutase
MSFLDTVQSIADLLILEVMAFKNKSLVELQKELYELVGAKFFNELVNLKLESQEQVKIALEKTKNMAIVSGFEVIKTDLKDGVKLYLEDNSSWILVRPSGTEPLLRIYFESDNLEKIETLKEIVNQFK